MGIAYQIVNLTKREKITFAHLGTCTKNELAGNPVSAAITTWYLLGNLGDHIIFIPDIYDIWPITQLSLEAFHKLPDMTDNVVNSLIQNKLITDYGKRWMDEYEPETIYIRDLRNTWWNI
jgi:hypothetical protein